MADQNITALPATTTPASTDQLLLVGAAEEKLIDYDKLADAILTKLTSKTFALDQGTKTLLQALNELNSNRLIAQTIRTSSDIYKSDFETWYLKQKSTTMYALLINAGWQKMMIGYKANDNYGCFIQIDYTGSGLSFCAIEKGVFKWS